MNRPRRRPPAELDRHGQALVEFALILPVLMLILMSIIQLGFIFGAQIGLINGVREGARYGSLTPTTGANATTVGPAVQTYLTTTVLSTNVMGYNSSNLRSASVTYCGYQNPGASTYSVRLTVSARYGHPLFIPLVGVILDGFDGTVDSALAITSTERFRVENMPLNASEVASLPAC